MHQHTLSLAPDRWPAARPFVITAAVVTVGAGLLSAALAHNPTRLLMWMVAYLVLVGGVVQALLALVQAHLATSAPSGRWIACEWTLFNVGSLGVLLGRMVQVPWLGAAGTGMFVASLGLFFFALRGSAHGAWLALYRAILLICILGAGTGLVLSLAGALG